MTELDPADTVPVPRELVEAATRAVEDLEQADIHVEPRVIDLDREPDTFRTPDDEIRILR